MNTPRFIHLRLHSEFSVTDGITRIGDAVKRAALERMPALGLSDLMNLFGMVKFYKEARGKGIKPVIGVVPYGHFDIDDEDSLSERLDTKAAPALVNIAVVKLPRLSNFTDFSALSDRKSVV